MNTIKIEKDKHIAFFILPRSGTTVLRAYLCDLLGYRNATELFNHYVTGTDIKIQDGRIVKWMNSDTRPKMTRDELIVRSFNYLGTLSTLKEMNELAVFSIYADSFYQYCPTLLPALSVRNDIQFIKQERADVLYASLSALISLKTAVFHNIDAVSKTRTTIPEYFDPEKIFDMLTAYVNERKEIHKHFPDLPTIYYEQFQMTPANMMHLFEGIPKKIISLRVSKFSENCKNLVTNLDEIEGLYEKFVNDNIEFFPQYNGTHKIDIPECQGRQPKIWRKI